MDVTRVASSLRAALSFALVAVIGAALIVDAWVVRHSGQRQPFVLVLAIAVIGIAWLRWPRAGQLLAVQAALISLVHTTAHDAEGLRFALFTEFVVLPVLFAAVLSRTGMARWPVAALVAVAAESVALRADDPALRWIVAVSMLVLLGAAISAVVYMRLRDSERRISIEHARQNERLDLARELHDVVGHHVTGMVVLAQANRFTSDTGGNSPAARAFAEIEDAGIETLTSVRRLIGLLRTEPSTSSGPRLADIERIIDDLRSTHPSTDLIVDDHVRSHWVPADIANTVQRLVQETATNVRRHGDPSGLARFTLSSTARVLELMVENQMSHPPSGPGYGIIGMRERVEALGGTFWAGHAEAGRWMVRATVPLLDGARLGVR